MATLEKPRKKKTKKLREKIPNTCINVEEVSEHESENCVVDKEKENISIASTRYDTTPPNSNIDNINDLVASTSATRNNIVVQECFVASGYRDDQGNKNTTDNENLSKVTTIKSKNDQKEKIDNLTPPAPDLKYPASTTTDTPTMVIYPQIQHLQYDGNTSSIIEKSPNLTAFRSSSTKLLPLSQEQLCQYYYCPYLTKVQQFEMEFLMNSLLETYESDPLYIALQEYYHMQSKLTMNLYDVKKFRKEAEAAQEHIWVEVPITKTFSEKCGDKIELKETVTYNIRQVDGKNLKAATSSLTVLFDIISNSYTSSLISTKVLKFKIDQMIDEMICYPSNNLDGPPKLLQQLDNNTLRIIAQIRHALSILFHFARKLSPNKDFDKDLKYWFYKLISLQLRLATKEDYWFLVFNILRCPRGVGSWAAEFIQIPYKEPAVNSKQTNELPLPLTSPEINLCISLLQILLTPIKKRNEYLKQFTQEITDPVMEEHWILLDSDGEDSHTSSGDCVGLKESDLVAFLNQIPFELLFRSALNIEKFLDDYIIATNSLSAENMMQIIAFFSQLITLFGEGLLTYNNERYKQLAKRLGRLIRHSMQYVSDYYELFRQNNTSNDLGVNDRIHLENKNLFLKSCSYIYHSQNLATWQYFSSLPYLSIDTETVLQIFYYLNVGFPLNLITQQEDYIDLLNAPDFWAKFNIANSDSSDEDMYYLLQAFFEMAKDRDKSNEWDLIKIICIHIFKIGFLNADTRTICYKTARDMLVNLTLAYEDLISCLLAQLKICFGECENVKYLFKSLPLDKWKPSMQSFEILSNWLLNFDFKTSENMLARIIISNLNWSYEYDGGMFLPHNIHIRMACVISEALTKHAPEMLGTSGISESVRQFSSLIDFGQSTKEQFSNWCWSMVSILRLHIMDQNVESVKMSIRNPAEALIFTPELENIDLIYQGVTENRPLALYLAILISRHGHSIPLICQKGFELMQRLLGDHRHAAVIRCLELIVPLFLETPETLGNSEGFHSILNTLLNADKTYLKMAKDIVYPNNVGPVLELMDNMIHHQIMAYTNYGLPSPLNLINIWLNCLTAFPNWPNTYVVYLLDKILKVAYQFPDAHKQCLAFFSNYYRECADWKGMNKMSTFKCFFLSNESKVPTISPYYPWLALVLLEIEFKMQDSYIWNEFMRQLGTAERKANVDAVLKKTLTIAKKPLYSAQMLVVYKYANLLANMDINHPLFPIINQMFFRLYLSRIPIHNEEYCNQQAYGVSNKLYEYNVPLMKKIKTQLKAAHTLYENEAKRHAEDECLSYFYRNCANIMKTYGLWLEDMAMNTMCRDQTNYPPQYNSEKLREIFYNKKEHWTEFLYLPHIRKEQCHQADQWARKCFRLNITKNMQSPSQRKVKQTPTERIKSLLRSYDTNLPPPAYVPPLYATQEITQLSLKELNDKLKFLTDTATKYHLKTSELNAINRNYVDSIVYLYKMVPYEEIKIKSCNSLLFNRQCTEPAKIITNLEMICKDENVQEKITTLRERHEKIIDEMLTENVDEFAKCISQITQIVSLILNRSNDQHDVINQLKINTGKAYFYHVIENISEITIKFNATNKFYTELLNDLGVFVQENQEVEGLKILELALERPTLIKSLSAVFIPCKTRPAYFLKMYKFLIDSHLKLCDTNVLFVLLSKFDLIVWLDTHHPKLCDINILLQLILQGLESWSQPSSSLLQDQFRRHLVHLFVYDFPEHYGEVMQMVLDRISDQKLMPVVLLDLLNALLIKFNCEQIDLNTSQEKFETISMDFAKRQNLFNLKSTTNTIKLLALHFQKERLNHGLHGLYPKHKDYCKPLAMWFSCFGHCLVVAAICTYQELLADQISDLVFGSIIEMYSPWLIIYTEQTVQQSSSNWIRQLMNSVNGKILYPWSEQQTDSSRIIIKTFIGTMMFILENLPISHKILAHIFSWYIHHFAVNNLKHFIYGPIHEGIAELPWEYFKPQVEYIDMLYDSLQKFIPESHAMLGHIFIRVNWNEWFSEMLPTIPLKQQITTLSRLFTIFIKISFEPNIYIQINTSKILEDAINYPWFMVEYSELENLLKWFVTTVDSTIILKMPSETNYVDRAVLDLIRLACAMMPERYDQTKNVTNAPAKRILYTRSMVLLQRTCAAKNPKLFATKKGKLVFKNAFVEMLNILHQSLCTLATTKSYEEQKREALNVILEIILPMQTQSEETSNLHIECLAEWQQREAQPGNILMCSILGAIGHMKVFIGGIYTLLETTIVFYFRTQDSLNWHTPSWMNLLQLLQMSLEKLELMPLINNSAMYTLHVFILYKMEKMPTVGDQITFLQYLSQLVENLKTEPSSEPILAIIWGAMISWGSRVIAKEPKNARKPLIMLAKYLQRISAQAENWGDGILGAIGFKTNVVTNKRKVLTRCLSIVIFSLFHNESYSDDTVVPSEVYSSSMRELSMLLANKKFNEDKPLIIQSIGILKENTTPALNEVSNLVCRLISIFYNSDLIVTAEEVWAIDFKMNNL